MVIGSHNSWSYLPPLNWWMWPFVFMSKCQSVDIKVQYEKYGVRCFDLRVYFDKGTLKVAHGAMDYKITMKELSEDLAWLDQKNDCYVRVLHEVRSLSKYTEEAKNNFISLCKMFEQSYPHIQFWCGRNLCTWQYDYHFYSDRKPVPIEPSCEEKYSSVCPPKYIDDWWPWIYAKFHNRKNIKEWTNTDILLIDYVNIR